MSVAEDIEIVDGIEMYRISKVDELDPFLMTVVSNSDLWMFLSSSGGLTAGRVEPGNSLFPYETDDRLHLAAGRVGPVTVLRVHHDEGSVLWEPFTGNSNGIRRSLLKSLLGNAVVFQEEHVDLGLFFTYRWAPSDRFGWIRTSTISNRGKGPGWTVEILDGLLGVMPWGVGVKLQQAMSNLANAYRRSELFGAGIGVFTLEALIVDRPEPAEALRATIVWSTGLTAPGVCVDPRAVAQAQRGRPLPEPRLVTGRPGAFLVNGTVQLEPGQRHRWHIAADVGNSHSDINRLQSLMESSDDLVALVDDDVARSSEELGAIIATADAFQGTGSKKMDAHHLANTLFNVMRGGTFLHGYEVNANRFRSFVKARNRPLANRLVVWLDQLPEALGIGDLRRRATEHGDPSLIRLVDEYLPLGFSRRHGDPSRPWNHFTLSVRDSHGEPLLGYQGNWRDIFQNWEALSRSFPAFLPSIVAKFLNASTADGFNPYRITNEGIDWEVPEPENPWSGIGYWGDHQIVYLLRLLEALEAHTPGWLAEGLGQSVYSFANVPYRIVPYERLVRNPKSTINHDAGADAEVAERVSSIGSDGKLLTETEGVTIHVTLLEKLLIPALAKLSSFVPRGGIWMNTQRPEWNDANNALVGYGLSMVTLFHLRRYLEFLSDLTLEITAYPISQEVIQWLEGVTRTLESYPPPADAESIDPELRAHVLRELGRAFERYRSVVYRRGLSEPGRLDVGWLRRFFRVAFQHLDDAIQAARRPDGLYDAYKLLRLTGGGSSAQVERLPVMLEGQVAAISSGLLDVQDVVALVETLYASELYRPDVDSFVLYPAHTRPSFMKRNRVPATAVDSNPLLSTLIEGGSEEVVSRDLTGALHFNADFRNASDLDDALDELTGPELEALVIEHRTATLDLFEEVFDHHAFTGRSGTMYAYEGIGSVYWHMVAKLLVAVQERILDGPDAAGVDQLIVAYERIRAGLGFNKTAAEYGAFPTDPYSHTPAHAGAQQPGMTGQVKEELLTRWAELGLTVGGGAIRFTPVLLNDREFRTEPHEWVYRNIANVEERVLLTPGQFGFTLCQVPIVVQATETGPRIVVMLDDGTELEVTGWSLDQSTSGHIFNRTGQVRKLDVFVPASS